MKKTKNRIDEVSLFTTIKKSYKKGPTKERLEKIAKSGGQRGIKAKMALAWKDVEPEISDAYRKALGTLGAQTIKRKKMKEKLYGLTEQRIEEILQMTDEEFQALSEEEMQAFSNLDEGFLRKALGGMKRKLTGMVSNAIRNNLKTKDGPRQLPKPKGPTAIGGYLKNQEEKYKRNMSEEEILQMTEEELNELSDDEFQELVDSLDENVLQSMKKDFNNYRKKGSVMARLTKVAGKKRAGSTHATDAAGVAVNKARGEKIYPNSEKRLGTMGMRTRKAMKEETKLDETAAADSVQMQPTIASKSGMMADVMSAMSQMPDTELTKWFEQAMSMANSQYYSKDVPNNAAEQNAATVAMKGAVKEDVDAMFAGEQLSEEFRTKAAVLFESAVNARVLAETTRIEEEMAQVLTEEVEKITESLLEQVDQYLTYAVEEWKTENEIALETGIKAELSESFIQGMKNLLAEHYVELPDDKVDVVEELAARNSELEEELNEAIKVNMTLNSILEEVDKQSIVEEVAGGLALTQKEKFKQLAETISYTDDAEEYKKNLEILKEHHFGTKKVAPNLITEQVYDDQDNSNQNVPAHMRRYAEVISRTLKR